MNFTNEENGLNMVRYSLKALPPTVVTEDSNSAPIPTAVLAVAEN